MIKVLFVCLGNICRSPMAEAIFEDLLVKKGLKHSISSDSAGTSNWHIGEAPDPRTIETVESMGIKIDHAGRQLQRSDFDDFDYILAMDRSNLNNIEGIGAEGKAKIKLMREYDEDKSSDEVPDPYFGGISGFDDVYTMLERSCSNFLDYLIDKHQLTKS